MSNIHQYIKEYHDHYLNDISKMFWEMHELHAKNIPLLYKSCSIDDIKEYIKNNYNYEIFFIKENEKLIGFISIRETNIEEHKLFPKIQYANIGAIYVYPEFRNKGYGTKLVDYAVMWAYNKNIQTLRCTVGNFNEASKALFSKYGFCFLNTNMIKDI